MFEAIQCVVMSGQEDGKNSIVRYEMLDRIWRNTRNQGVQIIAFGLGNDRYRWILSGDKRSITEVLRGFKVGTCRRSQGRLRLSVWERRVIRQDDLLEYVSWVHQVPSASLVEGEVNPWTSEPDHMGLRYAPFFDPLPLRAVLGCRLPIDSDLQIEAPPEGYSLSFLMRLSAAVVGRLPGHQKSFRLFVHLARFFDWEYPTIARALHLTVRRVRQLDDGREPLLWVALQGLVEPRLCQLP